MQTQITKSNESSNKEIQAPPFYTFEHKGEYFVFDTYNCVLFQTDSSTRSFLELCLEKPFEDAKNYFLNNSNLNRMECENIFSEVDILAQNGLLMERMHKMIVPELVMVNMIHVLEVQ